MDNNGNKVTVSEGKPSFSGSANPLNYPCTESAPLLNSVFAYIEIGDHHDSTSGDKENWVRTYDGKLHVGARAVCQNKTTRSSTHKGTLKLDWEVMEGQPSDNTVTGGSDKDIRNELIEWKDGGGFNDQGGDAKIVWQDFFTSGSVSASATVNDASTGAGGRQILVFSRFSAIYFCL